MSLPTRGISAAQHDYLMNPLRRARVAKRTQGGQQLSYLESWDVRAHLIRIFGFGNFDSEVVNYALMFEREYPNKDGKAMIEVAYSATVRLTIRNAEGIQVCRYQEAAVGQANGSADSSTRGDLHDNALKTAASDALKRCAINLGTQFGLSLYDNGSTVDVVKQTLVKPDGTAEPMTDEQKEKHLTESLGAVEVPQEEGATT